MRSLYGSFELFSNWFQLRIIKETSAMDGFDVKN